MPSSPSPSTPPNKPLIYLLIGCGFCLLVAFLTTGFIMAETTNCGLDLLSLNAKGEQAKAWSHNTHGRCILFSLGCNIMCRQRCDKLLVKMVETEKQAQAASGAVSLKYRCRVSVESHLSDEEEKPRPNVAEGEISLMEK